MKVTLKTVQLFRKLSGTQRKTSIQFNKNQIYVFFYVHVVWRIHRAGNCAFQFKPKKPAQTGGLQSRTFLLQRLSVFQSMWAAHYHFGL